MATPFPHIIQIQNRFVIDEGWTTEKPFLRHIDPDDMQSELRKVWKEFIENLPMEWQFEVNPDGPGKYCLGGMIPGGTSYRIWATKARSQ